MEKEQRKVRQLNADVARKIAAGEVIDRPSSIIRELLDNAIDSGANKIRVEIAEGGIEKIRVVDNGCGMTKEDLKTCAHPHATSKISSETDLLHLSTLGFRGEALSSMAAVSRLQIQSGGWKMNASITEDHILTPCANTEGTIVQTEGLFENFPARRQFLKRPQSEAVSCKNIFEEKILPFINIAFSFVSDGVEKLSVDANQSLTERFVQVNSIFESEDLFHEIHKEEKDFSFDLILSDPSVSRSSRKDISIYVNGRKIQEYALVQAIVYGSTGYFPNGTFPVACIFIQMNPELVDFNIHPAKKEVKFRDINYLHKAVSSATKDFYKEWTNKNIVSIALSNEQDFHQELNFNEPQETHKDLTKTEVPSYFEKKSVLPAAEINYSSPAKTYSPSYNSRTSNGYSPSSFYSVSKDLRSRFFPSSDEKNETADSIIPSAIKNDSDFKFIGCTLGTFLLAEKNETLFIIDQHAAHERILFNRILEEAGEFQNLLEPIIIHTENLADDNYLSQIIDDLKNAGFHGKKTGEGSWEFNTVPIRWKGSEADLKNDLLDRRISPKDIIRSTAASTACRKAVMDGTVLDDGTAAKIAEQALELPDPHCPHGRPVYTAITRKQLFDLVKRT